MTEPPRSRCVIESPHFLRQLFEFGQLLCNIFKTRRSQTRTRYPAFPSDPAPKFVVLPKHVVGLDHVPSQGSAGAGSLIKRSGKRSSLAVIPSRMSNARSSVKMRSPIKCSNYPPLSDFLHDKHLAHYGPLTKFGSRLKYPQ